MATYAGFIEHGDEQIGRLLAWLREAGIEQDTLIVLFSDNGPASETKTGAFRRPYGDRTSLEEMDAYLDELGTDKTQATYQRAWAVPGATPFRRYKLWPFLGGVRTPLIIRFPGVVKDEGAIRSQFVHVIDLAPTILEIAGTHFSDDVEGQPQIPVAGRSFLGSIVSASAPSARTIQFFELRGNRAILSGDWRAVAMHKPGTPFSDDQWMLFNLVDDPSESTDVAELHPEKLKQLRQLWWSEAERHGALPLAEPPALILQRSRFDDQFGI